MKENLINKIVEQIKDYRIEDLGSFYTHEIDFKHVENG